MSDLTGQTAIVTGGAQGIGLGIAIELAKAGARIVIADRCPQVLEDADLARFPDQMLALTVALDVTDGQSVESGVAEVIAKLGQVDILVNNAGVHTEVLGETSTEAQFEKCLDVNLIGIWRVSQAVAPHFKSRRAGKIINIASIDGRRAWAQAPAYSASKAGAISLTQSLAAQFGAHNINVNAVCPGGIITRMADAFTEDRDTLLAAMVGARAIKRPLLAEDIGQAVVFFASERSRNITGQALNVDGGSVMS